MLITKGAVERPPFEGTEIYIKRSVPIKVYLKRAKEVLIRRYTPYHRRRASYSRLNLPQ